MTPPTTGQRRPRPSTGTRLAALVLVLIPVVALMWVPSYTKATPRLWGFPFFYWYQLLWLLIGAACVFSAYLLLNRRPSGTAREDEERRP